ncbi:MAG TPA: hypothetical protein VI670_04675 [Thermoanaerobaculia bacterium]|jgi:CBS domain-containing protein
MSRSRPLPGIRFEAQAPPSGDALPRMDIPIFAGFAASGPVNVPVAVGDPAQFSMIFGGDVELPRPRSEHAPRFAHLGPTVRVFFRNGGARCWILRLAAKRTPTEFRIPNLVKVNADDTVQPAIALARAQGSWADTLRVQVNLAARPLLFVKFHDGPKVDVVGDVSIGDLVRLTWATRCMELMIVVSSVNRLEGRVVQVSGHAIWVFARPPLAVRPFTNFTAPPVATAAEVLTFDLTVRGGGDQPQRMRGLGFTPDHARAFGALPGDEALYRDAKPSALGREAASPRFPLAAEPGLYLPVGMDVLLSEEARADVSAATSLERDGLDEFDATLFLDPNLRHAGVRDLLDNADALRYEAGRTLTGIHAALDVDEATMLAVPDAVHRGWETDVVGNIVPPFVAPEEPASEECPPPCPTVFADCIVPPALQAPTLHATPPKDGRFALTWEPAEHAIDEVQEATRFDYADAATIFLGDSGRFDLFGRPPGIYYYRIRRRAGAEESAWSTAVVRVEGILGFVAFDDAGDDAPILQEIQAAMIRLCAARGDLVALLSLPRHYEPAAAIKHASALATELAAEPQALSYGALWHPWLEGRGEDAAELRVMPPEGAMAGVMAARANARGAWVPPANEPLRGVVALQPKLAGDALQALQDAAVNVVRQTPAGFLALDADTLSADDEIRPLNVRRLLVLLRKAAVRAGNDYTFEPLGTSLRNAVRRGFESLLTTMFQRGAFAGRTARDAYRVVTDETVSTPNDADNGRFIAELRVAPSRPLSFLTIRLLQRGGGPAAVEVR